jgi:DNA-binding NarL/FixJ family response regulator
MPTVLLADDSALLRRAIRTLSNDHPEIQLIGEAESFRETIKLVNELRPDIVLLDMFMSDSHETRIDDIKQACLECRIIVMSLDTSKEATAFTAKLGAEVLIDKSQLFEKLIPTILETKGRSAN